MPEMPLPFIKGDKVGSETDYRDALPVNMYAVIKPIFGSDGYMVQNYGLRLFGDAGAQCRGAFYNERQLNQFRVHGNDFIEVDEDGVVNVLGAVTGYFPQTNTIPPVTMDYSFNTQAVLADGRFYLYDTTNGYVEVTDPELGNPIDFCWIDGYYFFTDGEDLYHTLLSDETSIEPSDFGVAQFSPDPVVGVEKSQDNKVLAFSRYSIEYFVNDGSADFSFSRVQSRALKKGLVATHLKAELDNKWYMVGGGRRESLGVYALNVGQTEKVSTREIEKLLKAYKETDLVDSHMESYTIDKTRFIKIHLPNETLLFNETVAKSFGIDYAWSVLKSDILGTEPDRASYSIFDARIGEWVVGDLTDGKIGIMDDTVSTQYDDIIEWLLFSPFLIIEDDSIDKFEIKTIPGFTGTEDASVFVSITYQGISYSQQEIVEYGMIQEYDKRFIVRRLGYVRDYFSLRLRGASRSRMAFAMGKITHG